MSDMVPIDEEARVADARARLAGSIGALQARLAPKALAQDAVQGIVDKGQVAAQAGIDTARKHPAAVAGAVAAFGLLFARRPLARLLGGNKEATSDLLARSTSHPIRAAKRKAS